MLITGSLFTFVFVYYKYCLLKLQSHHQLVSPLEEFLREKELRKEGKSNVLADDGVDMSVKTKALAAILETHI